ncbi:MAG: hypothetical protein AAF639_44175 [Chloroflexota bacterium]
MNNIHELISEFNQQGVKLQVENEQLRIFAPKNKLNSKTIERLKANKAEILQFLLEYRSDVVDTKIELLSRPSRLPLSYAQ